VIFDDVDTEYGITNSTFVQDAFCGPSTDILVADIGALRVIRLEMPGEFVEGGTTTYRTEFTLTGSQAAIDKACPPL
jgi:hypothetical protein